MYFFSHDYSIMNDCVWTATGDLDCSGGQRQHQGCDPYGAGPSLYGGTDYSVLGRELDISAYPGNHEAGGGGLLYRPQLQQQIGLKSQLLPIDQLNPTGQLPAQQTPMTVDWSSVPKYYQKFKGTTNQYYFQTPAQKYQELVTELGSPTFVTPQAGGLAIWTNPGLNNFKYHIFKRIEIDDEQCFNSFPYPHIGFLYTSVQVRIPISELNIILSISGDISYDPVKRYLTVRGMSLGYNLAIIALICYYLSGDLSWYDIINNDLVTQITHHKRLTNPRKQQKNMNFVTKYLTPDK